MKTNKIARRLIMSLVAIITVSALSGCVVVPARGYYGGPVVMHAWVR